MSDQKFLQSKESVAQNTPSQAPSLSQLQVRAFIATELSSVDIGSDGQETEKDKRMLEWTINEIWKTCGKLPQESLRKLVASIKVVMVERNIYQGRIEAELKLKRDELRKEVEEDAKKSSIAATPLNSIMQSLLGASDITKIPLERLSPLKKLNLQQQEELLQKLDSDTKSMSKFIQAWKNATWRDTLKKNHPDTFSTLGNIYDQASKKYGIQFEDLKNPKLIQSKIESTREVEEDQSKLRAFTEALNTKYLSGLTTKINQQILAEKTSGSTFGEISNINATCDAIISTLSQVRTSSEYLNAIYLAQKSGNGAIKNQLRIFDEQIEKLHTTAKQLKNVNALSVEGLSRLGTMERRVNTLSELSTHVETALHGLKTGQLMVRLLRREQGNLVMTREAFEIEITKKIEIGGPKNVNARGFVNYLKILHAENKLNYEYLKDKNFLTQFGLHWKIGQEGREGGTTVAKELLQKENISAYNQFIRVIGESADKAFTREKIEKGIIWTDIRQYLRSQNVPGTEAEKMIEILIKSKGSGVEEILTIVKHMGVKDISPQVVRNLAQAVGKGYEEVAKGARDNLGVVSQGSLQDFLKKVSGATLRDTLHWEIEKIVKNNPRNRKTPFSQQVKLSDLEKYSSERKGLVEMLEKQIKKAPENSSDKKLLEDTLHYLRSTYRSDMVQTIAASPEVQKKVAEKAKIIKRGGSLESTLIQVQSDAGTKALVSQTEDVAVDYKAVRELTEKLEKLPLEEATLHKFLKYVGLDPAKITKAYIFDPNSRELQFSLLRLISKYLTEQKDAITPTEADQLRQLQQQIANLVGFELKTRTTLGTAATFLDDMKSGLHANYPEVYEIYASRNSENQSTNERVTKAHESTTEPQMVHYQSIENFDAREVSKLPAGTQIQLENNMIFSKGYDGSSCIITPYSIEIIPPEKTQIAIACISVAKIFPGLDFMGGLRETLRSYNSNPILAKMKDGVSKKEECNLIKHYAHALGIFDYRKNIDEPEALIESIKNCLPLGKSFWQLAHERGLLRNDGTINPIALGKTFETEHVARNA